MKILNTVLLFSLYCFCNLSLTANAEIKSKFPLVGGNSFAGNVSILNDQTLVSWWEKDDEGNFYLKFSVKGSKQEKWSQARTIVSGKDLFANWADLPKVMMGEKFWIAHYLKKSGKDTYAYEVIVAASHDKGKTWKSLGRLHRDGSAAEHGFVSYVRDGSGFRAFWLDGHNTLKSKPMTLHTALISENKIDSEQELDSSVCDCCWTASAGHDEGSYVAFRDRSQQEIRDIKLLALDRKGKIKYSMNFDDNWRIEGCPVNGPAMVVNTINHKIGLAWFTGVHDKGTVKFTILQNNQMVKRAFSVSSNLKNSTITSKVLGRIQLHQLEKGWFVSWLEETSQGTGLWRGRKINEEGEMGEIIDIQVMSPSRVTGRPQLLNVDSDGLQLAWTEMKPDKKRLIKFAGHSWEKLKKNAENSSLQSIKTSNANPSISVKNMTGQKLDLTKDSLNNKLVIFWALWCKSCTEKLPKLTKEIKDSASKIELITVNLDGPEQSKQAQGWLKNKNLIGEHFFDSEGKSFEYFQIDYLPAMIQFGKNGNVKSKILGEFDLSQGFLNSIKLDKL